MLNPINPLEISKFGTSNLHQMVDHLVEQMYPNTPAGGTAIINDIQEEVCINDEPALHALVIAGLLYQTLLRSWKNYIKISSKVIGNQIVIAFRNNIKNHQNQIPVKRCLTNQLAERLGGSIHLSNNVLEGTTIYFAFPKTKVNAC